MSKLRTLERKLTKARGEYETAISNILIEIMEISGIDDLHADDLAGDGLGIAIGDSNVHVGIPELIKAFENNGTITLKDLEQTSF